MRSIPAWHPTEIPFVNRAWLTFSWAGFRSHSEQSMSQNAGESFDAAAWSKLQQELATWHRLRLEVQAIRLKIQGELDAYRLRNSHTIQ
jgi:hypothetical protein